jgi:hypothetical protein
LIGVHRKTENSWEYDLANDYYYTILEKKHHTVKVMIDGDDYSYVDGYEWILNSDATAVITRGRVDGKGLSLLHEIMQADDGDIVYRADVSDPCVFDARTSNLVVYPADRPKGYRDDRIKRPNNGRR